MPRPDVTFGVDLDTWARTVQDIEAHHDDFSGRVFTSYARGLFRRILARLPPKTVGGGRRRIRFDYGQAYPRGAALNRYLRKLKRPVRTSFWIAFFRGDARAMREILKMAGAPIAGVAVSPFDGGRALRAVKKGKWGSMKNVPPLRVVLNPEAVDAHVRELEGHVGKLKSALMPALNRLSVAAPAYISAHGGGRGQFRMLIQKQFKEFDWLGMAREYDPAFIGMLQRAIEEAAEKHVRGMREEMERYRP